MGSIIRVLVKGILDIGSPNRIRENSNAKMRWRQGYMSHSLNSLKGGLYGGLYRGLL